MRSMLKPIPCESSPRLIPSLYGAVHVASGGSHSCALVSDGAVRCWGADSYGQLGDGLSGNGNHNSIPTAVAGLSAVSALAVGAAHTCAVLADKTARCWGDNSFGQLGLGIATLDSYKTEPTPVPGLESVVDLRAAIHTTCVTLADQTVQCWGDTSGLFKEPLASTDGNALKPTRIPDLARALSVRTAGAHACVRETDNTVACWGRNEHGELGNGSVGTFDYTLKSVAF
jgi:alpha-tubulin suppressor-like RCC1 family protein